MDSEKPSNHVSSQEASKKKRPRRKFKNLPVKATRFVTIDKPEVTKNEDSNIQVSFHTKQKQ